MSTLIGNRMWLTWNGSYEVCRQYMLKASDLLKCAEPNGFLSGGDHLFYIPNKEMFQKDIHKLSAETIITNNNMLVNSGTKSIKNEISKQTAHQDNRQWYFVTSHGWGDCPAGCMYRRNFLFVYDRDLKKASLVTTNGNGQWYSYFTSVKKCFPSILLYSPYTHITYMLYLFLFVICIWIFPFILCVIFSCIIYVGICPNHFRGIS